MATIRQRPSEDWMEYVARLERARLRARGEQERKEAQALETIGEEQGDEELKVAARARYAAADEFFRAIEEMERGAR